MKHVTHLLSGGLDSVTLLHQHVKQLGHRNVHCALVDYKQPHVQELNLAKLHCHRLGVNFTTFTLPWLGGLTKESWIVPGRNAILLSLACNLAVQVGSDTVTIGCNAEDETEFPDCRMAFIQSFNMMLLMAHTPVEVEAPYQHMTKKQIASKAKELGVPLHEVWTCYKGGLKPCGKCPACKKLTAALQSADIEEQGKKIAAWGKAQRRRCSVCGGGRLVDKPWPESGMMACPNCK